MPKAVAVAARKKRLSKVKRIMDGRATFGGSLSTSRDGLSMGGLVEAYSEGVSWAMDYMAGVFGTLETFCVCTLTRRKWNLDNWWMALHLQQKEANHLLIASTAHRRNSCLDAKAMDETLARCDTRYG